MDLPCLAHEILEFVDRAAMLVNPGKIFHSNFIGFPSIVSNVLCCGEPLNQLQFFVPKQYLILGSDSSFQDIRQNLRIRKPLHAGD